MALLSLTLLLPLAGSSSQALPPPPTLPLPQAPTTMASTHHISIELAGIFYSLSGPVRHGSSVLCPMGSFPPFSPLSSACIHPIAYFSRQKDTAGGVPVLLLPLPSLSFSNPSLTSPLVEKGSWDGGSSMLLAMSVLKQWKSERGAPLSVTSIYPHLPVSLSVLPFQIIIPSNKTKHKNKNMSTLWHMKAFPFSFPACQAQQAYMAWQGTGSYKKHFLTWQTWHGTPRQCTLRGLIWISTSMSVPTDFPSHPHRWRTPHAIHSAGVAAAGMDFGQHCIYSIKTEGNSILGGGTCIFLWWLAWLLCVFQHACLLAEESTARPFCWHT